MKLAEIWSIYTKHPTLANSFVYIILAELNYLIQNKITMTQTTHKDPQFSIHHILPVWEEFVTAKQLDCRSEEGIIGNVVNTATSSVVFFFCALIGWCSIWYSSVSSTSVMIFFRFSLDLTISSTSVSSAEVSYAFFNLERASPYDSACKKLKLFA